MGSGFLHIPQWNTRIKRRGDERVSQRMRPYVLGDPGAAGDLADDPGSTMTVQPAAQVQLVSLAGQAAVSGQEPGERQPLRIREHRRSRDEHGGRGRGGHRAPPGFGLRPGGWASRGPSKRREPHGRPLRRSHHVTARDTHDCTTDSDMCSLSPNRYPSRARWPLMMRRADRPVMPGSGWLSGVCRQRRMSRGAAVVSSATRVCRRRRRRMPGRGRRAWCRCAAGGS